MAAAERVEPSQVRAHQAAVGRSVEAEHLAGLAGEVVAHALEEKLSARGGVSDREVEGWAS